MSTSLSIKGKTQGNDAVTSTINYVNPNATDAQLVSLATAMNNLTTNTVADITRIDKNSLINTVEKQARNLKMSLQDPYSTPSPEEITSISSSQVPTDGLLNVYLLSQTIDASKINIRFPEFYGYLVTIANDQGNWVSMSITKISGAEAGSIVINIPEDDTYLEETLTLTITAS